MFPAIPLGFTILGEIFAHVTVFKSNHRASHILSSWMVHAGCIFVAGIHLSRIGMSGSSESMPGNTCVHRLDLGLCSHAKKFLGTESEPMLTPREKSPLPESSSRVKPAMGDRNSLLVVLDSLSTVSRVRSSSGEVFW